MAISTVQAGRQAGRQGLHAEVSPMHRKPLLCQGRKEDAHIVYHPSSPVWVMANGAIKGAPGEGSDASDKTAAAEFIKRVLRQMCACQTVQQQGGVCR